MPGSFRLFSYSHRRMLAWILLILLDTDVLETFPQFLSFLRGHIKHVCELPDCIHKPSSAYFSEEEVEKWELDSTG